MKMSVGLFLIIDLNSPLLFIVYSVQKWKEEKLIFLVEKPNVRNGDVRKDVPSSHPN